VTSRESHRGEWPADRPVWAGGPSARLRAKIHVASGPFIHACERLATHPRIAELYPAYLITLHTIVRATVPLMQAALGRAREVADADEAARALRPYLERHIEEERDHDEWLLEDLERLGIDRRQALTRVPSPSVAALVGSQYYWTFHYHPVALLGYFAFAEGYPPTPTLIETLATGTGLPPGAFRTIAAHGELDPRHRDELDQVIDALPLTPDLEVAMGLSAISSIGHMTRCVEGVLDSVSIVGGMVAQD
jgi:Iron-containing redox enzyme